MAIRPEQRKKEEGGNLTPIKKGQKGKLGPNHGKRGPSKKKLFERIKDIVYAEEGEYIVLQGAELVNANTGKPLKSRKRVAVRVKMSRADALAWRYVKKMMQQDKYMLDFIDRDTGKAVETVKMGNTSDSNDAGFVITLGETKP